MRHYYARAEEAEQDMPIALLQTLHWLPKDQATTNNITNTSTPTALPIPAGKRVYSQYPTTFQRDEAQLVPRYSHSPPQGRSENIELEPTTVELPPAQRSREHSTYKEGTVTRSGRQVKLSAKDREADV